MAKTTKKTNKISRLTTSPANPTILFRCFRVCGWSLFESLHRLSGVREGFRHVGSGFRNRLAGTAHGLPTASSAKASEHSSDRSRSHRRMRRWRSAASGGVCTGSPPFGLLICKWAGGAGQHRRVRPATPCFNALVSAPSTALRGELERQQRPMTRCGPLRLEKGM